MSTERLTRNPAIVSLEVPAAFGQNPELVALIVLIAGFVLARIASHLTGMALSAIDRRTSRLATTERAFVTPRLIRVTRVVIFWLVFALAVSVSLQVLGIGGISALIVLVIAFIPQLLVSFVIVVAGHLAGLIARNLVARFVDGITPESLVPRLAYGAILAVAIVMALQHLNVNISFITQLFLILVTIIGGGLMLAFALGARHYVANLLARREAERFAIGQRIRIDGLEGEVVDIHATAVDIATDDGIASIPAARFAESVVVRRPDRTDDG